MFLDVNKNTHYTLKYAFWAVICKVFFKWKKVLHVNYEETLHVRTINTFFSVGVLQVSSTGSISSYASLLLFKLFYIIIFQSLNFLFWRNFRLTVKLKNTTENSSISHIYTHGSVFRLCSVSLIYLSILLWIPYCFWLLQL